MEVSIEDPHRLAQSIKMCHSHLPLTPVALMLDSHAECASAKYPLGRTCYYWSAVVAWANKYEHWKFPDNWVDAREYGIHRDNVVFIVNTIPGTHVRLVREIESPWQYRLEGSVPTEEHRLVPPPLG